MPAGGYRQTLFPLTEGQVSRIGDAFPDACCYLIASTLSSFMRSSEGEGSIGEIMLMGTLPTPSGSPVGSRAKLAKVVF